MRSSPFYVGSKALPVVGRTEVVSPAGSDVRHDAHWYAFAHAHAHPGAIPDQGSCHSNFRSTTWECKNVLAPSRAVLHHCILYLCPYISFNVPRSCKAPSHSNTP